MIPVVLIHRGYQDYLKYSILQACRNNYVYLISDVKINTELFPKNFELVNIEDYSEGFNNFKNNYEHFNTTPYDFEVFCYHRWFILRNFMLKHNFDVTFYIDSDVMLMSDVEEEWDKFSQYHMTLAHRSAAVSSYMTYSGVDNFCNMLQKIYSEKDGYDFNKIVSHYKVRRQHGLPGGVCDMTLFEYFHYHAELGGGPGRVGEMMQIIDGSTYDHNINAADQDFEFINGLKHLKFSEGKIYCKNLHLNKDIKFNSVHCQGGAKPLMENIYEQCD